MNSDLFRRLPGKFRSLYQSVDRASGGALTVFSSALESFRKENASEAAASIAYYAIFSLFPMLLVMIAISSIALENEAAKEQVLTFISRAIPVSNALISDNIERVLDQRGTVGLVGGIGLLWSASGVFTALVRHINRAWPRAEARTILASRFIGLALLALLLAGLFLMWLFSNAVLNILPSLFLGDGEGDPVFQSILWQVSARVVPLSFTIILFLILYRWIPNREVCWTESLWGALFSSVGWYVTTYFVGWYFRSGLANYNLVYGSLGTVVALMFWIYLSSILVLFGAHLTSALGRQRQTAGGISA